MQSWAASGVGAATCAQAKTCSVVHAGKAHALVPMSDAALEAQLKGHADLYDSLTAWKYVASLAWPATLLPLPALSA